MTDEINVICLPLNYESPKSKDALTRDDVWGTYDTKTMSRTSEGIIVARHGEICPYFEDTIGLKR